MANIDLIIILTTAFLASVGHCIGMCGGIVIAYSSSKLSKKSSYTQQTLSHLSYNIGRVSSYTFIGAILGFVGQVIAFSPLSKGILFIITGSLMILTGLSLMGNIKILSSVTWSLAKYPWYQKQFKTLINSQNYRNFYLLGLLNGFIPCGLVYSFGVFAASTANPLSAALVMATFGLATIPALFFLGFVTKFLQRGSLRKSMMKLASLLVLVYGGITLFKGYNFIAYPELMKARMDKMHQSPNNIKLHGQFNGMKCAPGKCG